MNDTRSTIESTGMMAALCAGRWGDGGLKDFSVVPDLGDTWEANFLPVQDSVSESSPILWKYGVGAASGMPDCLLITVQPGTSFTGPQFRVLVKKKNGSVVSITRSEGRDAWSAVPALLRVLSAQKNSEGVSVACETENVPVPFTVKQTWGANAKWPKRSIFFIKNQTVCIAVSDPGWGVNRVFTPNWTIGTSFRVRYTFTEPFSSGAEIKLAEVKTLWEYKVIEDTEVNMEPAFVVEINRLDSGNDPTFQCVFYKSDFTMCEQRELVGGDEFIQKINYNIHDSFLYPDEMLFRIVDVPKFPERYAKEKRTITGSNPQFTQESVISNGVLVLTMRGALKNNVLVSQQHWQAGLPWWKTAERRIEHADGGRLLVKGELVEE